MAQIIKHKRGNLEGLKDATTRAGELLVVTGSSGLGTIANGADLVFVGIDGSTASPVNKILQGTTVPDLTGTDYNTHVDGIPFFDTDDNKLYILNKGGNIEVRATPQTGGTDIVSGSSQVVLQDADKTGFTGATSITTLGTIATGVWNGTAIANANLANDGITIDGADISLGGSVTTLQLGTSNSTALAGDTTTISGGQASAITANTAKLTNVSTNLTITGTTGARTIVSSDGTDAIIPIATTSVSGVMSKVIFDEHVVNNAKITATSANVVSALVDQATDFGSGRVSGDDFGDADGGSTITGSFVGDGSGLTGLATNLDVNGSDVDLLADDLDIVGTANEVDIATAKVGNDVTVTVGLPQDVTIGRNLTVTGDLQVSGTTTTIDSTTVQIDDNILELNGAGAANGGIHIKDATGGGNATGSLIYDTTNDVWKAGVKDSEIEIVNISGAQTLTNKVIGGAQLVNASVANTKLANDGITIAGADISLGGTITANTIALAIGTVVTGSDQIASTFAQTILDDGDAGTVRTTIGVDAAGTDNSTDVTIAAGNDYVTLSGQELTLGAINNDDLTNSSITIDGSAISLGGSVTTLQLGTSGTTALAGNTTTISGGQASAITANTAKLTNVSTNLTITGTDGARTIVSSDGTDAIIPIATTSVSGVMSKAIFDEHTANNAKTGITSGQASAITANTAKLTANSANVVSALVDQATDFGSGRVSGDNFGDVAGTSTMTGSFVGDGSALTGVASSLTVNTEDVNLKVDDLDIIGTANEIEISTAKSGNDVTVTVGIPTNPTLSGNVTVTGDLTVEGTTTTIDSVNVNIGDRILELNYAGDAGNAGLLVSDVDGSSTVSGSLLWNGANGADYWMAGKLGSEKEIATLNAAPTTNRVLKANSSGLLVDSTITDDGTDVSITGDLTVTGLTAGANGAFLYADANEKLQAVNAATAGDVIQWNGSSFVASNEVDGGTF
jgi:hypothetical protein